MLIAIITGAGHGIGRELTQALDYRELDEIWAIFPNQNALQNLFKSVKTPIRVLPGNLYDIKILHAIKKELENTRPKVKYLIHTEGLFKKDNAILEETSVCNAAVMLTEMTRPYMKKNSGILFAIPKIGLVKKMRADILASVEFLYAYGRALHNNLKKHEIKVTSVIIDENDESEETIRRTLQALEANMEVVTPTWNSFFYRIIKNILPKKFFLRLNNID